MVTLAAIGPSGTTATFDNAARRAADTLRISGVTVYPLGPVRDYAKSVNQALLTLDIAVSQGNRALRAAKSSRAQAAAADTVARTYGAAASALLAVRPSPADRALNSELARALRGARASYAELATAARKTKSAAYRRAARLVTSRQHDRTSSTGAALRGWIRAAPIGRTPEPDRTAAPAAVQAHDAGAPQPEPVTGCDRDPGPDGHSAAAAERGAAGADRRAHAAPRGWRRGRGRRRSCRRGLITAKVSLCGKRRDAVLVAASYVAAGSR